MVRPTNFRDQLAVYNCKNLKMMKFCISSGTGTATSNSVCFLTNAKILFDERKKLLINMRHTEKWLKIYEISKLLSDEKQM